MSSSAARTTTPINAVLIEREQADHSLAWVGESIEVPLVASYLRLAVSGDTLQATVCFAALPGADLEVADLLPPIDADVWVLWPAASVSAARWRHPVHGEESLNRGTSGQHAREPASAITITRSNTRDVARSDSACKEYDLSANYDFHDVEDGRYDLFAHVPVVNFDRKHVNVVRTPSAILIIRGGKPLLPY
jgi:hypothetical protein